MKYCALLLLFGLVAETTTEVHQNKMCGYGTQHGLCWIGMDGSLSCTNWKAGEKIADFTEDGKTITKRPTDGSKFISMECGKYKQTMCAVTDTGKLYIWNTRDRDQTLLTGEYSAKSGKFIACSCGVSIEDFGVLRDDGVVELFGYNRYLHSHRYKEDKAEGRVAADGTWRRELPPRSITKYYAQYAGDSWISNDGTVNSTDWSWRLAWKEMGYDQTNAVDYQQQGGWGCAVLADGRAACVGPSRGKHYHTPVVKGKKYIKAVCAGNGFQCFLTDAGNVNCFRASHVENNGDMNRHWGGVIPRSFEPSNGSKFVACACGNQFACCQREDGVVECPKRGTTPETSRVNPNLNAQQEAELAAIKVPLPASGNGGGGGSSLSACPASMTSPLATACKCEGEATECAVGKFCYTGGCKDSPQCTVRADVEKNIFYGAKVYGSWNSSTKIMSMNFSTPFDVTLNSIAWKNAASQQLKYSKSDPGLWTKDTSNACHPSYKLDVAQTTFFGDGSKFKITGSQLSTNLRVDASETVTTVKNAQTYTYTRSIKNTVPVFVNLITKTTIAVRFRSTIAPKGPGPAPALEDFVLFIAAEDNFATTDPNVLITMQVHSRSCIDHALPNTGVRVTTGIGNIKTGRASEFTWTKKATGDRKRDFVHNLCVEELQWKFVPAKYTENSYEIDLEFTLRVDQGSATAAEKFTTTAAIDIKQGDVLSDIGFTSAITPYEDANCTVQQSKFRLGQKFWTKIVLTDLVVPTHNITCNTYKIKQTKNGQTTETDLKNEVKYNFVEIKSTNPANSHICGAELESHHFHVSVDGYDTILETEIEIHYDQTNTRRELVQIPFTKDMWEAAGFNMEYEYEIGAPELSEEDLEFQNTKRAPDQDDMVVDLFIEAEKTVGIFVSEEAMSSLGKMFILSAVVAGVGYGLGFYQRKTEVEAYNPESKAYSSMVEM